MKTPFLRATLVAALAGLALSACDRTTTGDTRTVGQKLDRAVEKTQQKLAETGPKVEAELNAAGERIAAATDKVVDRDVKTGDTGRAMSDTAITASIKTDLIKDPDLSALKIDVDTKDGVVTLQGLADNEAAKQRAEKMASAVKGVKEVRNFLTIKRV